MNVEDRKRLEQARLSPEAIAKLDEVLRVWEVDRLFVTCGYCGTPCISPEVRKHKFRRKKPPSELFWKVPLGFAEPDGDFICVPCYDRRAD